MMYLLDTDHLSLLQRNGAEGQRILAKLAIIEAAEGSDLCASASTSSKISTQAL